MVEITVKHCEACWRHGSRPNPQVYPSPDGQIEPVIIPHHFKMCESRSARRFAERRPKLHRQRVRDPNSLWNRHRVYLSDVQSSVPPRRPCRVSLTASSKEKAWDDHEPFHKHTSEELTQHVGITQEGVLRAHRKKRLQSNATDRDRTYRSSSPPDPASRRTLRSRRPERDLSSDAKRLTLSRRSLRSTRSLMPGAGFEPARDVRPKGF